jgi:surface antigen
MKTIAIACLSLSLAACAGEPMPAEPAAVDVSGMIRLEPTFGDAVQIEQDGTWVSLDQLEGGSVYVDPTALSAGGPARAAEGDEPAMAFAPQCFQSWKYDDQQVTGTAWRCFPRQGGGQWCLPYAATFSVIIKCDTRNTCQTSPPNGVVCTYQLNGQVFSVAEPSGGEPCPVLTMPCPGTGNPDECIDNTPQDCP